MKIIKINYVTIYLLLILFLCGYIKIGLIILFIVLFHELGHVLIALRYHFKIIDITIYPFGGITRLEKLENTPVKKDIMLSLGGIINQLILYLIVLIIPLNPLTKELIYKYNTSIILFNLLPIIPLDGSLFIKAIYNKFFSYKHSLKLYIITSIISIIAYLILNYWYSLNNYLIIGLFIYKIIEVIKNNKYIINKFLLERYLNKLSFKDISLTKGNLDNLKIDTYHYFIKDKKIINEEEMLRKRFK